MRPAFPASEYYGGSAPPAPSADDAPIRRSPWMAGAADRHTRGSHVHCVLVGGLAPGFAPAAIVTATPRAFTVTSRPRPGPGPGVPRTATTRCNGPGAHRTPAHIHRIGAGRLKRRNNTGSSRIPPRLAHRTRPIRQCWTVPTSSRLLPPSPAIPGSGCRQLHPTAATAGR